MRIVYVLQSCSSPSHFYVGMTDDLPSRLLEHNAGETPSTKQHRPWRVVVSIAFVDARAAAAFEKYLKSGSGRSFAKRHFPGLSA